MTISAKIIADSVSGQPGTEPIRITTMQLRYPRFIHSEFMTHRVFSRNASSSRAIPVEKLIQDIIDDTAMPSHWGKNQPGMQADEECFQSVYVPVESGDLGPFTRKEAWNLARDRAIEVAKGFNYSGYHKQIVNRLLEPFSHINVLVTATDWDNFYELRRHRDAQPEIHELADRMWEAQQASVPRKLFTHEWGSEWHLPYVTEEDHEEAFELTVGGGGAGPRECHHYMETLIRCSVARCARVSYMTHDMKKPTIEADLKLYDRLVGSVPKHASPAEHQATPDWWESTPGRWQNPHEHGNFNGFRQWRHVMEKKGPFETGHFDTYFERK